MLAVSDLNFDYPNNSVLQNINFTLQPGTLLHLLGDNGTGKTTLIRLIAGLLLPNKGRISWQGQDVQQNLTAYHRLLCYIGHKPGLNLQLTIRENYELTNLSVQYLNDFVALIEQFQLQRLMDKPCYQLSAGQLKRATLLRLIVSKACLWILDEPLVSLDNTSLSTLSRYIENHLANQGIIILSSHQALPVYTGSYQEFYLS